MNTTHSPQTIIGCIRIAFYRVLRSLTVYATVLRSLPPRARILDCACGIGIHSLALARHGYDVRGTDASAGMIAEARRRAALEGLEVEFAKCSWADLPKKFTERFDLVFVTEMRLAIAGHPKRPSPHFAGCGRC